MGAWRHASNRRVVGADAANRRCWPRDAAILRRIAPLSTGGGRERLPSRRRRRGRGNASAARNSQLPDSLSPIAHRRRGHAGSIATPKALAASPRSSPTRPPPGVLSTSGQTAARLAGCGRDSVAPAAKSSRPQPDQADAVAPCGRPACCGSPTGGQQELAQSAVSTQEHASPPMAPGHPFVFYTRHEPMGRTSRGKEAGGRAGLPSRFQEAGRSTPSASHRRGGDALGAVVHTIDGEGPRRPVWGQKW